jgi:ligand-binding sensor domain-containing protein/signal transduction histidine kinase
MKTYTYLLFLSTVFLIPSLKGQFTAPRFQRITIADGLPNGEVHQIREDADGFIWIATGEGICRFDGYKMQLLQGINPTMTTAINADRPLHFEWDNQKQWWIASDWAGARLFDPIKNSLKYIRTAEFTKITETPKDLLLDILTDSVLWSVLYDGQNRIWLGGSQGIQVFDRIKGKLDKNPQLATPLFNGCLIQQISKDAADNIWAAVTKKGLYSFDKHTQTWSLAVAHPEIRSFTFDKEGAILWISPNDFGKFQPKTKQQTQPFKAFINSLITKTSFMSIHYDKTGRIWLGTTSGLVLLRGGEIPPQIFKHDPRNPYSLLSDVILAIYEDSKGNIWVSCGSVGVCLIPNSFERIQVFENPTTSYRVEDIAIAPDSTLYALVSSDLLISHFPYYRTNYIKLSSLLPCIDPTTRSLAIGKNGKIYLLTTCGIWEYLPHQNYCRLVPNTRTEETGYEYLSFNIWGDSLLTFNKYNVEGLKAFNLKTGKLRHFNTPTLNHNNVFTDGMVQDKQGDFWSNSIRGLIKMGHFLTQPDTFRQTPFYFNLKNYDRNSNGGKPLMQIGDDLWWGRFDGGGLSVMSLRDTAYGSFTKANGLFDNSVISLSQDKLGHLWAGTNLGISRIQLPTDFRTTQRIVAQNFSAADGLPHNTVLCSQTSLAGDKVFVGTVGGLAMINTVGGAYDTIPPKLVFTNLTILNKIVRPYDSTGLLKTDINQTHTLTLKHNQAFFTLEVSGLNFVNPQLTRYAYRLTGLKGEWIDNGFSNILSFNNIAYGTYLLEVKAQAHNGLWSAVKTMNIQVLSPIWLRWWFIGLLILAVSACIYAIYRFRIRQLERVQALQNNIAADLHDDVGAALTNIEILSFLSKNQIGDAIKIGNLIDKIGEEAKKTNESLHQLVWTMKTENDGLEQTLAQLNRLAVDNLEIQNIRFSVTQSQQSLKNHPLNSEKRRDLIMVFKEVLANITKHAQATEVRMAVDVHNQILKIDITDNGIGISPKKRTTNGTGGNGLKNIKTRMERHGGQVAVQNSPNEQGVLVEIRMPL